MAEDWITWEAKPDESDILVQLEVLAFEGKAWGENAINGSFVTPGVTTLFGGKTRASPAGFAIWRDLLGEAELLTIGVVPELRRQGLGEALLDAVIKKNRLQKTGMLFLEVDAANKAALSLYDGRGFKQIGLRRAYYRNGADAVTMALTL